jgi:hypothetical protein
MYDPNDARALEKYSSAVTLSDMEIFIFPELMYSLVLANIMSPRMWEWQKNPWFDGLAKMPVYRRVLRLKQFIMDNFAFNLDLDTWGLTTKERELARFSSFIDEATLSQSNALFGYEGDKYYFDIDIRKHFGLDKYTSNIIPYWKTETLEAMEAFKYKEGYGTGAGECVSLSTLYASALFAVAGVPLQDIFVMATPLHSQNFFDVKDGIITNNRRLVTKNMWFNGSELSEKARRALEHEKVVIVANNTGHIHTVYDEATIDQDDYRRFSTKLRAFLKTDITYEVLASFLRSRSSLQKCFQIAHNCGGKPRYIEAEKVYAYEHNSKSHVGDQTQESLLTEIDEDEFYPSPVGNRIMLNEVESFFKKFRVNIDCSCNVNHLKEYLHHTCFNVDDVIRDLLSFCRMEPRLPGTDKKWATTPVIDLEGVRSHDEVIARLEALRSSCPTADLAFTAYRDMTRAPWRPFLKAAMERSPVSIAASKDLDLEQVAEALHTMDNESIYSGTRMAQPDEVWNYRRGDGLEKALCLMNIVKSRAPQDPVSLDGDGVTIVVKTGEREHRFLTAKKVPLPRADEFVF